MIEDPKLRVEEVVMTKPMLSFRSPALLAALLVPAAIAISAAPASAAGPAGLKSADGVMLNPQPLPPRYRQRLRNPWAWRALNPQPLPPNPCRCLHLRVR